MTKNAIFSDHKKHLRKVRYKQKDLEINSTILLWDNMIGFITNREETFGTLIESEDFATTMKSWFQVLWSTSED